MNIVVDLSSIINFFNLPPEQMLEIFIYQYGWLPVGLIIVWGAVQVWLYWRQSLYKQSLEFILLAIDIPRSNDLSPKGVENLFSYLGGGHEPPDLIEKWWLGMFQLGWSFEIVSIEGYIQYLVQTPKKLRELLESAVYSQYPDAEITEVNDYTEGIPTRYPNEEYNVWGAEFVLSKPDAYPIKTYREFEHQASPPEKQFKDPMAVFMDMLGSMGKGEQFWYQLIVYPTDVKWSKMGDAEVAKILREKPKTKKNIVDSAVASTLNGLWNLADTIFPSGLIAKEEKKEEDTLKMMNLKPKEKRQVEGIQNKLSKQGFECKIRFVYVAKREVFNKAKAIYGVIGFIKQFMDLDNNNLKPDMEVTATTAHYFFTDYRKNEKKKKLVSAYKDRTGTRGRQRFFLNTEELATLWHFPIEAVVKAPLIQKAPGRKAEPPMSLPFGEERSRAGAITAEEVQPMDGIFLTTAPKIEPSSPSPKQPETIAEPINEELAKDKAEIFGPDEPVDKGQPPNNLPFV